MSQLCGNILKIYELIYNSHDILIIMHKYGHEILLLVLYMIERIIDSSLMENIIFIQLVELEHGDHQWE